MLNKKLSNSFPQPHKTPRAHVRKMYAYPRETSQNRGAASEIRTPDLGITSALGLCGESRNGSKP
jgi:hypothetical protein